MLEVKNGTNLLNTGETLLPLAQAIARIPGGRGATRPHRSTILRWVLKGTRAVTGEVVRLEAVRVGTRWLTSEAALSRFATALSASPESFPTARTPSERTRAADRAAEALKRLGA